MDAEKRTRLWSRDTRSLRLWSWWIAAGGVCLACCQIGLGIYTGVAVDSPFPITGGVVDAAITLMIGFFLMAVGRVLATIAEISWFAHNSQGN